MDKEFAATHFLIHYPFLLEIYRESFEYREKMKGCLSEEMSICGK
jgi:hypothetical protein